MSYRHYEPNAIGSIVPPFSGGLGGGGGSSGPDRFAPKYLVGNVPNGDSAVAYATDGFVYLPDPGDGTGIEAALAQAALVPGDVWIRPGTYTFAPRLAQLDIPAETWVRGSGIATVLVYTFGAGQCGNLFRLLANSALSHLRLDLTQNGGAVIAAVGDGVIVAGSDAASKTEHLWVNYTRNEAAENQIRGPFSAAANAQHYQTDCRIVMGGIFDSPLAFAGWTVRGSELWIADTQIAGGETAVACYSGSEVHASALRVSQPHSHGFYAEDSKLFVTAGTSILSASSVVQAIYVTQVEASSLLEARCEIECPDDPQGFTVGIRSDANTGTILGCHVRAATGINTSLGVGAGHTVVGNIVEAAPGQEILSQVNDEVAHNILV